MSEDERLFLLRHDSNGVNRWLITQELLTAEVIRVAATGGECDDRLVNAMADMLPALALRDAALGAKLLQLPSVQQLLEQVKTPDPNRLHEARLTVRRAITAALEPWFVDLCQLPPDETYVFSAAAMAKRALANTALGYLVDFSPAYAAVAVQRFSSARNMTDAAAALTVLVHSGCPAASACLESFGQQWRHEALVTDQWFAIQASAPLSLTIERVRELLKHPSFDRSSPNRVRALLGQFANANPVAFHDANGAGYRLLCDQVGELDAQNPQLAARLLGAMAAWSRMDKGRQEQARAALERLDRPGISSDLSETLGRLRRASLANE